MRLLIVAVALLLVAVVAAAGGALLFAEDLPGAIRGVGLLLIVICPWLFRELLRERPKEGRKQWPSKQAR